MVKSPSFSLVLFDIQSFAYSLTSRLSFDVMAGYKSAILLSIQMKTRPCQMDAGAEFSLKLCFGFLTECGESGCIVDCDLRQHFAV